MPIVSKESQKSRQGFLKSPGLPEIIRSDPSVSELLHNFKSCRTPGSIELEGPEGACKALILALLRFCEPSVPALVLVPTEREAEELAGDLNAVLAQTAELPKFFPDN